jgi:hypothetical protein
MRLSNELQHTQKRPEVAQQNVQRKPDDRLQTKTKRHRQALWVHSNKRDPGHAIAQ